MSLYESIVILKQDVTSTMIDKLVEDWEKILENSGGKILKHEYLGFRQLSYRIQNNSRGHYVLLCIDGPSSALKEYERKIRLSESIIRFINLKVKNFSETPIFKGKTFAEPEVNVTEQ